ncbi:MAG: phytoene desaturase [Verrucomicrobia bacterium]|nr:phytoene desaturase [Verrucomicrobiota bacterium]
MAQTAIIIGSGLGGMATAIRLARDQWKVKVLEKNSRVGGKLDCHSKEGFLWDVGPTLVTMPFVLRDLFEYAGHDIEDYLELLSVDPVCRYFYPDGKVINAWANFHHFQIEVARREKDHGEALEGFMRYARSIYDLSVEAHLFRPPQTALGYLAPRFLKQAHHLPRLFGRKSMAEVVERHFKDPHIRQLFLRYATTRGSSPYRIPAAFNIIPYVEMQGGGWYIRGGMYLLAEAMEKCARDLGVEFLVGAEVSEITLTQKGRFQTPRANGVVIRGGVRLDADVVICNADAMHAWTRLLSTRRQQAVTRRLDAKPFSSSPFVILWGVKRRYEQLAHHNVFFSSDYLAEFDDLFNRKRPAAEPTVYVCISTRTDPTQAPPGQDNFSVLVHTPAIEPDHHWEQMRLSYRDTILARLEKMGLDGLRHDILCEKVISPADFALRTNAYRGAIYGHATHAVSDIWSRQPNRCAEVSSLYFVGGMTHPGGGIPMVLLSAQRAAAAVNRDAS